MQKSYSRTTVYRVAKDNYKILVHYCKLLETDGYWEQPSKILKQSIYEILDVYISSILLTMALQYNCLQAEQKEFISSVTDLNLIGIDRDVEVSNQTMREAEKIFSSPPILLQLCGLRDCQKNSSITGLFFDAILNIIISFAYLSSLENLFMMQFIEVYFKGVQAFIHDRNDAFLSIDQKYIFRKLSNGDFELSKQRLLEAGEDFSEYKKRALYYNDKSKEYTRLSASLYSKENAGKLNRTRLVDKDFKQSRADCEEKNLLRVDDLNTERYKNTEYVIEKTKIDEPESFEDALTLNDEAVLLENISEKRANEKMEVLLKELNSLIGLECVKSEVISLINLIKVKKIRAKYQLPQMDMSYHMVFTGNPGTGKTTVARLIAAIYKELGLLSEGNFIETDRSGLVAGFVGQTALKVKEVVERAIGGVLFIDEAYSLSNQAGANDFGSEAIDTLVKLMEDYRDDLVVIVAGYTKEMKQFLKANSGLVSRFNRFMNFADYTDEELIDILKAMAEKAGFILEEKAMECIISYLSNFSEEEKRNFGNARGMRNMFETMVVSQANRIVLYEEPSIDQLTTIVEADVRSLCSNDNKGGNIV